MLMYKDQRYIKLFLCLDRPLISMLMSIWRHIDIDLLTGKSQYILKIKTGYSITNLPILCLIFPYVYNYDTAFCRMSLLVKLNMTLARLFCILYTLTHITMITGNKYIKYSQVFSSIYHNNVTDMLWIMY